MTNLVIIGDKNLYLTIINKEHGESSRDAKNLIVESDAGLGSGQNIFLFAPNNDAAAISGETLGGGTIQNDGSWDGKWTPLKNVSEIKIPAASAAVVRLTNR